ncbi:hypothetical protein ACIPLC_27385 [Kitasatospora sp. NPDC086801]|uniref:hypothetical protein n=1 Tax=Kitasatospora sp. NPDC086801 TaxID=3364066 RepID=UPI0038014E5E
MPRKTAVRLAITLLSALAAGTVAIGVSAAPVPAHAADGPEARPNLSIALTDGQDRARPGERLTWTLTVRNQGDQPVTGLRIEQLLPAGARPAENPADSVAAGSVSSGGTAHWDNVSLDPHAEKTLQMSADLADTGSPALRSSSRACAYTGESTTPLVCASDLDLLTAGDQAAVAGKPSAGQGRALPLVGAAAAAVAAATGVLVLRRRRTRTGGTPDASAADFTHGGF